MISIGNDGKSFEVAIAGREGTVRVPLASSLKVPEAMKLNKLSAIEDEAERNDAMFSFGYELMCGYLGQDVVDSLTFEDFTALLEAWNGTGEVTAGESHTSPA